MFYVLPFPVEENTRERAKIIEVGLKNPMPNVSKAIAEVEAAGNIDASHYHI